MKFSALLNTPAGDRYLFSGRAGDKPATETLDHILNGDGARAGLKQMIAERNQADLGANGLGRLAHPAGGGLAGQHLGRDAADGVRHEARGRHARSMARP